MAVLMRAPIQPLLWPRRGFLGWIQALGETSLHVTRTLRCEQTCLSQPSHVLGFAWYSSATLDLACSGSGFSLLETSPSAGRDRLQVEPGTSSPQVLHSGQKHVDGTVRVCTRQGGV